MAPTGTPPLPPEVAEQMGPRSPFMPAGAMADGMQTGGPQGQPPQAGLELMRRLGQKIQQLEQWADETSKLIEQTNPALKPLLMPIAQAGIAMKKEFVEQMQRSGLGKGSPQAPGTPPPNPAQGPEMGSVPQG